MKNVFYYEKSWASNAITGNLMKNLFQLNWNLELWILRNKSSCLWLFLNIASNTTFHDSKLSLQLCENCLYCTYAITIILALLNLKKIKALVNTHNPTRSNSLVEVALVLQRPLLSVTAAMRVYCVACSIFCA